MKIIMLERIAFLTFLAKCFNHNVNHNSKEKMAPYEFGGEDPDPEVLDQLPQSKYDKSKKTRDLAGQQYLKMITQKLDKNSSDPHRMTGIFPLAELGLNYDSSIGIDELDVKLLHKTRDLFTVLHVLQNGYDICG